MATAPAASGKNLTVANPFYKIPGVKDRMRRFLKALPANYADAELVYHDQLCSFVVAGPPALERKELAPLTQPR